MVHLHWKHIRIASILLILIFSSAFLFYFRLQKKPLVGILLHDAQSERWLRDGFLLQQELKAVGCRPLLFFSSSNSGQKQQFLEFLKQKPAAIIISAADTRNLNPILEKAADQKCRVIAYDRLITGSHYVDAFLSFDSSEVGEKMAAYVLAQLEPVITERPIRIAIIGGSQHDNNSFELHNGILRALDSARKAGRIELANDSYKAEDAVLRSWSREAAAEKLQKLLLEQPSPDAVICCSDLLASGVLPVLQQHKLQPLLTGQDADRTGCRLIARGQQAMTVFKDSRLLARQTAVVTRKLLDGLPLNQMQSVDNGSRFVPTFYIPTQVVTAANLKKIIFDSGYYHSSLAPQDIPDGFTRLNSSGKSQLIVDLRFAPGSGDRTALPGIRKAKAILTREAAAALELAVQKLAEQKLCLVVLDSYRPEQATLELQKRFASENGKLRDYSRCIDSWDHTHGSSVDVSLATMQGELLDLGKQEELDSLTPAQKQNRERLTQAMIWAGFEADSADWWHFRLKNEPYSRANFNFDVQ